MKSGTLSPELPVLSLVTFESALPSVPTTFAAPSTLGNFFHNVTRRAKLVFALRRAFVAFSDMAERHTKLFTGLTSSDPQELAAIETRCKHLLHRYEALESVLAKESGLSESSVYNFIVSGWPMCSRLLRASL